MRFTSVARRLVCIWLSSVAGVVAGAAVTIEEEALAAEVAAAGSQEASDQFDAGQAAAYLDCEGLGQKDSFWPAFRRAFSEGGPLGSDTLELAYERWSQWEELVDRMDHSGQFGGQVIVSLPGVDYLNGTKLETRVWDRMDLIKALQRANFQALFGRPPPWGPEDLAGFLACPVGFVLVQYVVFLVHKVRSRLPPDEMKLNWDSFRTSFGMVLGLPSYVFDHLESSSWGVSSFDLAVNMNTKDGSWVKSYDDYCQSSPVPPPRVRTWQEDAPMLALSALEPPRLPSLCRPGSGDAGTGHPRYGLGSSGIGDSSSSSSDTVAVRVALLGEHGPTNIDHLSTASAAIEQLCAGSSGEARRSVRIEAAHFFTYLWKLEGTAEGSSLRLGLRLSWEAFWGEPLTESQGRHVSTQPRWTVWRAIQALRGWASREPFLRSAGLLVCCEPLWLCMLLHAARGGQRLLVRASMCLLHAFVHVFGGAELKHFWPHVRAFGSDMVPRGSVSAAARITAEMLAFQTGIRAPYVPALSLHVAASARYAPTRPEVLFFRSGLPSAPAFLRVLRLIALEVPGAPNVVQMPHGPLSFADIAKFRAVAMLPHVPHALRLSDVYAMGLPALVPAQPLLHKFMWPHAGPFCGRTDPELARSVDALAANRSRPPFSPFEFQGVDLEPGRFHDERRYWAQYSEWEVRPHLLRFRSARHLLELAALSETEALAVSERMRRSHRAMVEEALGYWRVATTAAIAWPTRH